MARLASPSTATTTATRARVRTARAWTARAKKVRTRRVFSSKLSSRAVVRSPLIIRRTFPRRRRRGLRSSTNTHRPLPRAVNRDEGCPCGDDLMDPSKCGADLQDPCVNENQPCKCDGQGACVINYLPDGTICDDFPLTDPCKQAKQCSGNVCTGACRRRGRRLTRGEGETTRVGTPRPDADVSLPLLPSRR